MARRGGALLVFAWLLRNSVVMYYADGPRVGLACYGLLLGCGVLLFTPSLRVCWPGLVMVLGAFPGSFWSTEPNVTLPRFVGWALLVVMVGPVVRGRWLGEFRRGAWRALGLGLVVIGTCSCAWWLLGLPVMGRGDFTGVMNHSNLVGPLAGLGCVLLLNDWLARTDLAVPALIGAFSCALPCLASGSRLAAISLMLAAALLAWLHWGRSRRSLYLAILLGLTCAGIFGHVAREPRAVTSVLRSKGFQNTRSHLWTARWAEFKDHPGFGVGIGTADGDGIERDVAGWVNVEPGSSYLAVLSMTGLVGAGALVCMVGAVMVRFWSWRHQNTKGFAELSGVGVFLAVHAFGEGWIFAVGSPIALIFWLWVGRVTEVTR